MYVVLPERENLYFLTNCKNSLGIADFVGRIAWWDKGILRLRET